MNNLPSSFKPSIAKTMHGDILKLSEDPTCAGSSFW